MSIVNNTITNCPGCGAALNAEYIPGQITYVSCQYCKTRVAVTAPGVHESAQAAPEALAPVPTGNRRPALGMAVAGAVVVVIGAAAAMVLMRSGAPREQNVTGESLTPAIADRSSTIVCYGGRRMVLENETVTKDQTAVVTAGNCTLTIKNANLASPTTALVASGDSVITIDNSIVSGENAAIIASGNARVRIVKSTVKSGTTGLISSGNSEVDLDRCNLQGGVSAYIQSGEGHIILKDTKVQGRGVGKAETR